jgi:hypothetical protein
MEMKNSRRRVNDQRLPTILASVAESLQISQVLS